MINILEGQTDDSHEGKAFPQTCFLGWNLSHCRTLLPDSIRKLQVDIYPSVPFTPNLKYRDITWQSGKRQTCAWHSIPLHSRRVGKCKYSEHDRLCICAYEYISCYYCSAIRFQVSPREGKKSHYQYSCTPECQLKADSDKRS